jgi:ribosomal-protein-alanine N-acetyltransferase
MTSFVFKPFPLIETGRLLLRQLRDTDVDEIYFLRTDERVMRFLDRPPAKSKAEAAVYITTINQQIQNGDAILWGITCKPDDRIIGSICFWRFEKEHYRAETGYVLHPAYHGKGIMKEALNAVLVYGFESLHLHSVMANVSPDNAASIQLLKSAGFEQEGYLKENFFFNGLFLDTVVFGIVNSR